MGPDNAVVLARAQTPPAGARAAAGATVSVGSVSGTTDGSGAFTLAGIPTGLGVLHVATAAGPSADLPVTIFGGATAILGSPPITRATALATVMNALSAIPTEPQATIIIGPQEPLPVGTTVAPAYGDENGQPSAALNYTVRSEQWLIFVDPNLLLRYSKPVKFFFVDAASGALTKLDEMSWPLINGLSYYGNRDTSMKSPDLMVGPKTLPKLASRATASRTLAIVVRDSRDRISTRRLDSAGSRDDAHLLLASLGSEPAAHSYRTLLGPPSVPQVQAAASSGGGTTYAMVIEGADESDENADISTITQMFGHGGIPPAYVTFSKPGDSVPKDKHGQPQRREDLIAKFQQQCMAAGPDDTLFLYITAHGVREGKDGVQLDRSGTDQDGQPFDFQQLSSSNFDFSKCKACNIIIVIDACYSGAMASGFNDILKKTPCPPNYTIVSATDSSHSSLGIPFYGAYFTSKFVSAFTSQAADTSGSLDLTQAYKTVKGTALSMLWQNPQIYVRYPSCPCHPPTETACNTGPGTSTANQTGTATGTPTTPGTATATGTATGSDTCQPANPTNPTPTNANNIPSGATTPAPETTPTTGGVTPQQPQAPAPPSSALNLGEKNIIQGYTGAGGNPAIGPFDFPGTSSFLSNGANTAINVTITIFVQDLGVTADMPNAPQSEPYNVPPTQEHTRTLPPEPDSRRWASVRRSDARFELASLRMDERVPAVPVPGMALFGVLADEPQAAQVARAGQILYSLVANGNSSGQALELQVFDPSGQLKDPEVPEGTVLEPVKQGSAKSLAEMMQGASILRKPLVAYCVDYLKLPPEANMLYRLAPPAVQDKLSPIRAVMQAGRELAAAGKFHPDSDAAAYNDSIRQYALWTKIEGWGEDKFGEVFVEKTKQNALSNRVKWTKQIEQAVRGLVPGRWRDISMVLDEAQKLPQQSPRSGAQ